MTKATETNVTVEAPVVEETPQQVIERLQNTKVRIFLPFGQKGEAKSEYVAVNGYPYQVPRGEYQYVPRSVFEILRRRETARIFTEKEETAAAAQLHERALRG